MGEERGWDYAESEFVGRVGARGPGVYKVGVQVFHCYRDPGVKVSAYVWLRGLTGDEDFTADEAASLSNLLSLAAERARDTGA